MEKVCYLVLDFDGVLVPGEELMDNYVWDICKEASNKYCDELFKEQIELIKLQQSLEEEREDPNSIEEVKQNLIDIEKRIKKHFDLKDQVLEETEPKYKNRIDYDEIYQRKNVYPGILELLWKIHDSGLYVQLINNTHVNSEREIVAKRELLKKDFPPMKFVPIMYHSDRYYDQYGVVAKDRKPSDKVGRLLKILPYIEPSVTTLVDNSKSIIKRGEELGLICFFVEKNLNPYIIENPVLNPIPCQVILDATNNTIENIHENKVKKLTL